MDDKLLKHWYELANKGDAHAKQLLLETAKELQKRSNMRLLRLEKAGLIEQSQAYNRAQFFIEDAYGGNRFKVSRKTTPAELKDSILEMEAFLSKKSSSVAGLNSVKRETFRVLKGYGIEVAEERKNDFFSFIQSDTVQDVVDYAGDYDVVYDIISNAISKNKKSFEQLEMEFDDFLDNSSEPFDKFAKRLSGVEMNELYNRSKRRDVLRARRERRNRRSNK